MAIFKVPPYCWLPDVVVVVVVAGLDVVVVGDVAVGEDVAVVVVGFSVTVGDAEVVVPGVLEQAGKSNIIKRTTKKLKNTNFLLNFHSLYFDFIK
jgi:hypothetical protein